MKSLNLLIILSLISLASFAQAEPPKPVVLRLVCKSTLTGHMPLFVILHKNKEYQLDSTAFSQDYWNPDIIESIAVMTSPKSEVKYKEKAKNGVVLITLNEKRHPKAFKDLKKHLSKLRPEKD